MRPPAEQDFEAWAAFAAEPETMRFLGGPATRSEAWRNMCMMAGAWTVHGFSMFSVIERATGRWIGRIGPWQPDGWPGTEVAWALIREYTGRGYAHEAAVAAMDYAVDVLGWTDIIHTIHPENTASIRLAEKLGATNRGPVTLPAPLADMRVEAWGQSADAWRARRSAAEARDQAASDSSVG